MRVFSNGNWDVKSILINEETVMNNEGFQTLKITDDEFEILPIGFRFRIRQSTSKTAVLESRGQVFYANFSLDRTVLTIELARPKFKETIRLEAELVTATVEANSN